MTAVGGQASVEYAGLLGLAAVLGAGLALVAGPPLLGAVRNAFVAALSGRAHHAAAVVATAADIADVESALRPTGEDLTPDAALLALAQRHGARRAAEIADSVLLAAARGAAPWLGTTRTYRAWLRPEDGPYEPTDATTTDDRDIESATGEPSVTWVTVAAQRRALAAALAHHTTASAVVLDVLGAIPGARLASAIARAGVPFAKPALEDLHASVESLHHGSSVLELVHSDDQGVPPGLRAGDVAVAWPVRRIFWRAGRSDRIRPIAYLHRVVLRPVAGRLRVIAEELAT